MFRRCANKVSLSLNEFEHVWMRNKEFVDDHNRDIMEAYLDDECKGRVCYHRVIFRWSEDSLSLQQLYQMLSLFLRFQGCI